MQIEMSQEGPAAQGSEAVDDRLLRAAEIQRELGVSRATAYRMMTDGTLPAYRFGGRNGRRPMVRVSLKELRTWLARHRAAPPHAA
jgi:excisionase family DNA binding protein